MVDSGCWKKREGRATEIQGRREEGKEGGSGREEKLGNSKEVKRNWVRKIARK